MTTPWFRKPGEGPARYRVKNEYRMLVKVSFYVNVSAFDETQAEERAEAVIGDWMKLSPSRGGLGIVDAEEEPSVIVGEAHKAYEFGPEPE